MALKAKKAMQTMPQMRRPKATLLPSRSNCLPPIAGAALPRRFPPLLPVLPFPRYERGHWPTLLPLHAGDGGMQRACNLPWQIRHCPQRVTCTIVVASCTLLLRRQFRLAHGRQLWRDAVSGPQHIVPLALLPAGRQDEAHGQQLSNL